MSVRRRTVLLGVPAAASAGLSICSGLAWAADPEAVARIEALNQALVASMRAGRSTPFAQRYSALAPVIERTFDLAAILRSSVGTRWSSMPPAEQAQLLDVFRKFTVCSYAANFVNGSQRIDIVPESRMVDADQVVATQLSGGGDSTRIDYVMHRSPDGWKAIDVLLNGSISQVAVNRSDWRSLLGSGAGALVSSLQRRVADLSGGAIQ